MCGVSTRATGLDGGRGSRSLRQWLTRCRRTRIGTKNAVTFTQPVEAMRIVGRPARLCVQQQSWAGRGPVVHCGIHSSRISRMIVRPSSDVHKNLSVGWVQTTASIEFNKRWARSYTWCGNLNPIGFLRSVTPKEPSLPTGSKTDKPNNFPL